MFDLLQFSDNKLMMNSVIEFLKVHWFLFIVFVLLLLGWFLMILIIDVIDGLSLGFFRIV